MNIKLIHVFIFLSVNVVLALSKTPIVCYYVYKEASVDKLSNLNCSHIILIGSAHLTDGGHLEADEDHMYTVKLNAYYRTKLLSITSSNPSFSVMTSDIYMMRKFANDSLSVISENGFAGIDIDWEFPVWSSDAKKTDRAQLAKLLEVLHDYYRPAGKLVSIAVSGPPTISKVAYEMNAIRKYADMVQVMNYDFHVYNKLSNPLVGFNAPIHPMKAEISILGEMNIEASMRTWIDLGLPMNITYFGIPIYARAYKLLTRFLHKPYSPAVRALDEYSSYDTICRRFVSNDTYTKVWNRYAQAPYLYGPDGTWISYENERSLMAKIAFAQRLGVAGIMVYSIGSDDWKGHCEYERDFPLLKIITKYVHRDEK